MRTALGVSYKDFEARLEDAIHIRFGLPPQGAEKLELFIKKCAHLAAYLEATQLAGFAIDEAEKFFGKPKGLEGAAAQRFFRLKPLATNDAAALYLRTFRKLSP
mgnify:CR=1 FL=1